MKRFMVFSLILACSGLVGCAWHQASFQRPLDNPRVVERDLTIPYGFVPQTYAPVPYEREPEGDAVQDPDQNGTEGAADMSLLESSGPDYFIGFSNESLEAEFPDDLLKEIVEEATKAEGDIFLIGHSHGGSAYGNARLATGRAAVVADILQEKIGGERLHTLASWSKAGEDFAPACGVQIYFMDSGKASSEALLLLSKL